MVTARTLVEQRIEGLDAGADDYLTKPFAIAELLARLRALLRRRLTDGRMLKYADLKLDRNHRRADRANQSIPLTPKEFLLLELLMMRAPNVVGREEILEHVWQMHFDPQTNLVEVHINRLRQKLSESGEMKIIHTVHGVGYCLRKTE
jgi:DNA-binding response OmpR family regulator